MTGLRESSEAAQASQWGPEQAAQETQGEMFSQLGSDQQWEERSPASPSVVPSVSVQHIFWNFLFSRVLS